uniref:Uncharacterized protein n=1 Tax=Globisporangium ultimum (strain ATCC 200006 / CBS 805.95 / DAOM BR144) TaxID=431595 RepID=K3X453_GLOUD
MELLTSGAWIAGIVLFQFIVSRDIGGNSSSGSDAQAQSSTHSRSLDPRSFPLRTELHLQRKAQHALTGLLFYAASWALPSHITVVALFVAAGVFFIAHQLRKLNPRVGRDLSVGDPAASLVGTLYSQHNHKTNNLTKVKKQKSQSTKSWTGFAGALVASSATTFLAMSWSNAQKAPIEDKQVMVRLAEALFAGIAAAIAEMISIAGWDDNLSMPLITGLFLELGSYGFGFQC